MKGSGPSVTRLNDDTGLPVLRHALAKPVDNDNNIYNKDKKQCTLRAVRFFL